MNDISAIFRTLEESSALKGLYQGAIRFTRTPFIQAVRLKHLISPLVPNLLKLYLQFFVSQFTYSADEWKVDASGQMIRF